METVTDPIFPEKEVSSSWATARFETLKKGTLTIELGKLQDLVHRKVE